MATKQRLRELAYADMNRECAMYDKLCGNVIKRIASPKELGKYRTIAETVKIQNKWKMEGEKYGKGHRD